MERILSKIRRVVFNKDKTYVKYADLGKFIYLTERELNWMRSHPCVLCEDGSDYTGLFQTWLVGSDCNMSINDLETYVNSMDLDFESKDSLNFVAKNIVNCNKVFKFEYNLLNSKLSVSSCPYLYSNYEISLSTDVTVVTLYTSDGDIEEIMKIINKFIDDYVILEIKRRTKVLNDLYGNLSKGNGDGIDESCKEEERKIVSLAHYSYDAITESYHRSNCEYFLTESEYEKYLKIAFANFDLGQSPYKAPLKNVIFFTDICDDLCECDKNDIKGFVTHKYFSSVNVEPLKENVVRYIFNGIEIYKDRGPRVFNSYKGRYGILSFESNGYLGCECYEEEGTDYNELVKKCKAYIREHIKKEERK